MQTAASTPVSCEASASHADAAPLLPSEWEGSQRPRESSVPSPALPSPGLWCRAQRCSLTSGRWQSKQTHNAFAGQDQRKYELNNFCKGNAGDEPCTMLTRRG